ncbi:MAG: DUF6361 family protein [Anaerolineales bacterium]
MDSTFTWLDYSEHERRKMLDVIKLFSERETRDELGVGSVRDAFADLLFPGTSTIQTRARYFFFVPWIYLDLEKKRIDPSKIADRARQQETNLIKTLLETGETEGVIGKLAQDKLQRLPSNIYWQGLGALGIRLFSGSQDQYHRSLSRYYAHITQVKQQRNEEMLDLKAISNWHVGLPSAPVDFPNKASFSLTKPEAEFLREQIQTQSRNSLMAYWVSSKNPPPQSDFPWDAIPSNFLQDLRIQLSHAQNFSEALHGAALLYNLLLAEQIPDKDLVDIYRQELSEWEKLIKDRIGTLKGWDIKKFWEIAYSINPRIPRFTRMFVEEWLELALAQTRPSKIFDDHSARELIRNRERFLKRGQSRLENRRALDLWTGAAGTGRLNYRWRIAQSLIKDIHEGLK